MGYNWNSLSVQERIFAMKVYYDRQGDGAYICLSNKKAEGVVELSERRILCQNR